MLFRFMPVRFLHLRQQRILNCKPTCQILSPPLAGIPPFPTQRTWCLIVAASTRLVCLSGLIRSVIFTQFTNYSFPIYRPSNQHSSSYTRPCHYQHNKQNSIIAITSTATAPTLRKLGNSVSAHTTLRH